jgi:hypothetical protein
VIPEFPDLPVSPVLAVFRVKLEIQDRWDLRAPRAPLDTKVSVVLLVKKDLKETRGLRVQLVSLVDLVHRVNVELLVLLDSLVPKALKVHLDREVCLVALVLVVLRVTLVPRDPRVQEETKVPWVTLESLDHLEQEA